MQEGFIQLDLLGHELQEVQPALHQRPGQQTVGAVGVLHRHQQVLDDALLSKLLNMLVVSSVQVVTLREVPLSLEDAYMAISGVTEDEEQEEELEKIRSTAMAGQKNVK